MAETFSRSDGSAHGAGLRWWLSGPLLGPVLLFGGAVILAAGPWLVSVLALVIISVTMTPAMGFAAVEDLRLTVVYSFCIAPLAAGPIGAVAARRISAEMAGGALARVPELFLAAGVLSSLATQAIALAVCLLLGVGPAGFVIAFVSLAGAAALLWTSFAVLAAVKAYGFLIAAFSTGMALSVLCTLLAASHAPTTELLIWCFTTGVLFCVALCLRHVQRHFPTDFDRLASSAWGLVGHLRANLVICAGVLFAICGVWVDKWIFWFGPDGVRSASGLLHYSAYDSVMFLAHLSIIPSYAALLVFHYGGLVSAIGRFRAMVSARATYASLRSSIEDLARTTWRGIFLIGFVQGAITIGLVLMAPLVAKWLDFSFEQFLMLRIGLIGAFLHAVMFLCCAVLLVTNRNRHNMLIHGGFLTLNLVVSLLVYAFAGISAYAFFAGSLVGASVAFAYAYRAVHGYDYLYFLGENDSLLEE